MTIHLTSDLEAMIAGQIVAHAESANGERPEFLLGMESMARGMCVTLEIEWKNVARRVSAALPSWVTAIPDIRERARRLSSP